MVSLNSLTKPQLLKILTDACISIPNKSKITKPQCIKLIEANSSHINMEKLAEKNKPEKKDLGIGSKKDFLFTIEMYNQILSRIDQIEFKLNQFLALDQKTDLNKCSISKNKFDSIDDEKILLEIKKIVQNERQGTSWVKIDDLYESLAIFGADIDKMDIRLLNLFYNERIELAEGGISKHKIRSRGSLFGILKIRS